MSDQFKDPTRVGNIIICHRRHLRDTTAAIYSTTTMLREVLTEFTVSPSGAWPKTWDAPRYDAVLALIEAAAEQLYDTIAGAVDDDDAPNASEERPDDVVELSVWLSRREAAELEARARARGSVVDDEAEAMILEGLDRIRRGGEV
ncbi:MAG: hypothetical protein EOM91_15500 [Sphingobacteriia bacterium]|nr:hypothetical protein [Sphingobacteriia bacterium]